MLQRKDGRIKLENEWHKFLSNSLVLKFNGSLVTMVYENQNFKHFGVFLIRLSSRMMVYDDWGNTPYNVFWY